ncbi:MAG: alanine dehydrogenase [Alphaproteobacteria bacterium]
MRVGVPKEIKKQEARVGLVPGSVREFVHHGHDVIVETQAGSGIGFSDEIYRAAGATVVDTAAEVFATVDMLVKVKEPQPEEIAMLRDGQVLFTYLHLAADKALTEGMLNSGCIGIAYETVTNRHGHLPLLAPMSEVAGRMSIQVGAHNLERRQGGGGILLGGVPGVAAAKVLIIGGGVSGINAARMAMGMEAKVTVLDKSLERLAELDMRFGGQLNTQYSTVDAIESHVMDADLVIGAVLVPGAAAPKLVTEDMVRAMRPGSVMVDIAIDQGGCFATSRPTSHDAPTFLVHDVVHYCVTNMPGAVARTSTFALNNATLPFALEIAERGYRDAMRRDPHLRNGLNIHRGAVTYEAVARDLGLKYVAAETALG